MMWREHVLDTQLKVPCGTVDFSLSDKDSKASVSYCRLVNWMKTPMWSKEAFAVERSKVGTLARLKQHSKSKFEIDSVYFS